MSLHEQQNLLARLYTNAQFRREFLSEPAKIGFENGLDENEIAEIVEILPEEINFFAESLYWKRLREVEKMLPLTKEILKENFARLFREFSQNYNPQTVKKHLEDAIKFGEFLIKSDVSAIGKNAAKFEKTKLEFFGYAKRFALCKLDFDFRTIDRKGEKEQVFELKKKTIIAIWLKIGSKTKHFNF